MSWVQSRFTDFAVPKDKRKCESDKSNEVKKFKVDKFAKRSSTVWSSNWKPKKKEDLIVHKKKVEEVEAWLDCLKKGECSSFLLVNGPPGCGKLTTLKVLSTDMKINLIEWIPQLELQSYDEEDHEFYESELHRFESFVLRATRYRNVLNSQAARVIVVKDIPNKFIRESNLFHEFLENYSNVDKLYIIFITTDSNITRDLFNDNIKRSYNIKTINFNPLTAKMVSTALKLITGGRFIEYIQKISLSCHGDLREGLKTLEFLAAKQKVPEKIEKDKRCDIFHGLGQVLYAKKENGKLTHNPVTIGESFTSSPQLFLGMLQENYLNTFSSIHHVCKAADSLSVSDMFLSHKNYSNCASMALINSTFGLMLRNLSPIKKFQQFNKPGKTKNEVGNILSNLNQYSSDALMDIVSYGRHIPSFSGQNKQLYYKLGPLN